MKLDSEMLKEFDRICVSILDFSLDKRPATLTVIKNKKYAPVNVNSDRLHNKRAVIVKGPDFGIYRN